MIRTTTPDIYTATVRHIRDLRKQKRISPFAFAVVIRYVWEARHAEMREVGGMSERLTPTHAYIGRCRGCNVTQAACIELQAWQEKVCAIIQPAENGTEWGMDVADIIALRENQRRETRAELNVKLQHVRAYLEYVNHYTDLGKMSDEQRQLYDVAWEAVRRRHPNEVA